MIRLNWFWHFITEVQKRDADPLQKFKKLKSTMEIIHSVSIRSKKLSSSYPQML